MSNDDSDDLSYNPFTERDDYSTTSGGSNLAQGYYSSAFFPKVSHTLPTLRRRRSFSTDISHPKDRAQHNKHNRARTDIQINVPTSAGLHPLKSALARIDSSSAEDLGNTRPNLSRIVNEGGLVDIHASGRGVNGTPSQHLPKEEKDVNVLIHQVSSSDSLPGVSLKYGISLANLRRANQLWPSDSIHRRELLYIPIDQASRAREYLPEPVLITFSPDEQTSPPHTPSRATSASAQGRENSELIPPSPVRRIPAKQLSYFPPSSHKTHSNMPSDTSTQSLLSVGGNKALFNRYSSSPGNNSLASILTALPIAASTRDEIITRLSFDSVSSSFSDRSRINSDEDDGHELDEVKRPGPISIGNSDDEDYYKDMSQPTPKASQRTSSHVLSSTHKSSISSSLSESQIESAHQHAHSSTALPRFYVSQAQDTYVRTSQLEPSPGMKLPTLPIKSLGRSSGKAMQNNRMQRTSSLPLAGKSKNHIPSESGRAPDIFKPRAPT